MAVMTVEVDEWEKMEKQLADYKGKLDSTQWEHSKTLDQLKKHGGHTAECASRGQYIAKKTGFRWVKKKCDCNWAEIAKGGHRHPKLTRLAEDRPQVRVMAGKRGVRR